MTLLCCVAAASTAAAAPAVGARGVPVPIAAAPDAVTATRWQLPVEAPIAALFVRPALRWGAGHRGVDIEAGAGMVVRAPREGVVAFVGTVVDRGVVALVHPDGLRSSLEPVTPSVHIGETIGQGEVLGVVSGEPAHCPGCLHWGVRVAGVYLDPLSLLGRERVVLLPIGLSPGRPLAGRCAVGASLPCASARSGTR